MTDEEWINRATRRAWEHASSARLRVLLHLKGKEAVSLRARKHIYAILLERRHRGR